MSDLRQIILASLDPKSLLDNCYTARYFSEMIASKLGMDEIMCAVATLQRGERANARNELIQLWQEWSERDAPLQRCTIAHFLADTEDDPDEELAWDLRALEVATGSQDQNQDAIDPDMAGFLPSLHLNVGDAYRRTGDTLRARRHAKYGLERSARAQHDGYDGAIRAGLERLSDRLLGSS